MKARYLIVGVALILPTLLNAGPAIAATFDNMFPAGPVYRACTDQRPESASPCQTDNSSLTVFHENNISAGNWSRIRSMLASNYEPTALAVSYPATASYTGSAETDIVYRVNSVNVPAGYVGWTWCNDAVTTIKCDQAYVAFNTATDAGDGTTGCHETGHAVGLLHGSMAAPAVSNTDPALGCMRTPWSPGLSLGSYEAGLITSVYR